MLIHTPYTCGTKTNAKIFMYALFYFAYNIYFLYSAKHCWIYMIVIICIPQTVFVISKLSISEHSSSNDICTCYIIARTSERSLKMFLKYPILFKNLNVAYLFLPVCRLSFCLPYLALYLFLIYFFYSFVIF